jgi:crotonobetainyl-CoA:carnitine CoA-transferase CaiB-like acyl-CoA transferase
MVHGKESIALDLKTEAGVEILHQLARRADCLLHSFRPGVPERLRMDYATLSEINPRLVYLYAGSYGSKGPQSHRAAFHSTPHALAGGGFLQAGAGNPPADDSYPDPGSGLGAATALLLGLLARERTGRGQSLETTMLCTTGYIHSGDLVLYEGRPPRRLPDKGQHGPEALYRLYPCESGWIFLAARREAEWRRLAHALDRPGWLDDPRFATRADRLRHDAELAEQLGASFRDRPADDWVRALRAADLPVARADPHSIDDFLLQNELLIPAEHPVFGKYWRPHLTVDFPSLPGRLAPPTGIGEYTRPLLAEMGYSQSEIDSLVAEKIVC